MNSDKKENTLYSTASFIHQYIYKDLDGECHKIHTRFPPEPNGYLHIGHAKSICLNFELARIYGGKCNLRFDDTNPAKEDKEYVKSIMDDIKWLGFDWEDRLFFASDYFEKFYECAVYLIKKGKAFVCDLTTEEIKEYRGTLTKPGKNSPYRNRSIEENLKLFEDMRKGIFEDGSKTLRAKIDMSSSNINMRDPVIYRISRLTHHNTKDKWCIYPMYDYAHPLEDAFEKITHSICTMEFEDHKPLYNWFIEELDFENKPRQIEFAKLKLTNSIMGKRYLKKLVENKEVDGWDDPRMLTLAGIRRRGYTPESIRIFCEKIGISKSDSKADISLLEHCVRDDLKEKVKTVMAILDPIKVIITNYPEDKVEYITLENNPNVEEMGKRKVAFSREIYIEREDFMEEATKNFFRLSKGKEVRLKGSYFIKCEDVFKDEDGNIKEILCTYDPKTKSGSGFTERKVKSTIHWVSCKESVKVKAILYDYLVFDDENSKEGFVKNENSIEIMENCYVENSILDANIGDRFQFIRKGYFIIDTKTSTKKDFVFNRIVSLKNNYKPK